MLPLSEKEAAYLAEEYLDYRHEKIEKNSKRLWTKRFVAGHESCMKFLQTLQEGNLVMRRAPPTQALSQRLYAPPVPSINPDYNFPWNFQSQFSTINLHDVMKHMKNPLLFTLVVTWNGLSYKRFTAAMTLLGLGDICIGKT